MDEGYIKFDINHTFEEIKLPEKQYTAISHWRQRLMDLKLLGQSPDGIGYGNISFRLENGFIITGSATGDKTYLEPQGYARVMAYEFENNTVESKGLTKASSESLSHAAIYEAAPEAKAVIHVHDPLLWNKYKNVLPTTSENVAYGTPGMAYEIIRLFNDPDYINKGIIIMGGHPEGIITFGSNLEEAGEILIYFYKTLH